MTELELEELTFGAAAIVLGINTMILYVMQLTDMAYAIFGILNLAYVTIGIFAMATLERSILLAHHVIRSQYCQYGVEKRFIIHAQ
uniref:Uncharacterized protein n=1 Tax=Acrobeloides nanus TaxID=290746 RepID=A0A914CXF5_9BILA